MAAYDWSYDAGKAHATEEQHRPYPSAIQQLLNDAFLRDGDRMKVPRPTLVALPTRALSMPAPHAPTQVTISVGPAAVGRVVKKTRKGWIQEDPEAPERWRAVRKQPRRDHKATTAGASGDQDNSLLR